MRRKGKEDDGRDVSEALSRESEGEPNGEEEQKEDEREGERFSWIVHHVSRQRKLIDRLMD